MPKFVRRQPLIERIKAYLDPADWLLYVSEELDTNGWDHLEKEWAIPIGIALNLVFLIARSNQHKQSTTYDDVFGEVKGAGWFAWLVSIGPFEDITSLTLVIRHPSLCTFCHCSLL